MERSRESDGSRRDLSELVEGAQIPIVESDRKMIITHANEAAQVVFGYAPNELVGNNVKILMMPETASKHDGYVEAYETTGVKKVLATVGRIVIGRKKDGSELRLRLTTSQTPNGYAAVFVDITHEFVTECALAAERSRADAEHGMNEFLVSYMFMLIEETKAHLVFLSDILTPE